MRKICMLMTTVIVLVAMVEQASAWSGNYERLLRSRCVRERYCACYFWGGCIYYRHRWRTIYYYTYRCRSGWTHNRNQNCNIPVCNPTCGNGGTCTAPNKCDCTSTAQGPFCRDQTCSYQRPCYPGRCEDNLSCTCELGFQSNKSQDGCIHIDDRYDGFRPFISKSNVTIADLGRSDNKLRYYYTLDATNLTEMDILWSNQRFFNKLWFEFEATFDQPEEFPSRPPYVGSSELGVIQNRIEFNHTKIPRDSTSGIRDPGNYTLYNCAGNYSREHPAIELAECVIENDQFTTSLEHGDWINIKFKSNSGGFQRLINIDQAHQPVYATKYYTGLQVIQTVEFRFDFFAPKHCLETDTCSDVSQIMSVHEEFTKLPVGVRWFGWTDEMSGILEYYVEFFKLTPNGDGRLVEMTPVDPVYSVVVDHVDGILEYNTNYTPAEPGMYSILVETRDAANNTKIARRLVLYDDTSNVTLDTDHRLYFSSAVEETGYLWQTSTGQGNTVNLEVRWDNRFANLVHERGKLLDEVESYPIQYVDIGDDGILISTRFVNDSLDDFEGARTKEPISNIRGIVKFDVAFQTTSTGSEPTSGWKAIPLSETTSHTDKTETELLGYFRVWVRATDILGNQQVDQALVRVDPSPPAVSLEANRPPIDSNVEGPYAYSSMVNFAASDQQSGVFKYAFDLIVTTTTKSDTVMYSNMSAANIQENVTNPHCNVIEGQCFLASQSLYIDNCWLMVSKADLDNATASVAVTAYNQALLTSQLTIPIGKITLLKGLERYNGPQNIRIENQTPTGFRMVWDLPQQESCYGRADIIIILSAVRNGGHVVIQTFITTGSSTFFDILGLDAEAEYHLGLQIRLPGATPVDTGMTLKLTTPKEEKGLGADAVAGVAIEVSDFVRSDNFALEIAIVGVIAFVVVVIIIFGLLIRRGVIQPPERVNQVRRAVTRRVRGSRFFHGAGDHSEAAPRRFKGVNNMAYDNRQSELYIYGGMDLDTSQKWHISRNDVTFDTVLTEGHFATIYKARVVGMSDVLVAKTLKRDYSDEDLMLMKAKINFSAEKVGHHPNVLKFIGTVVDDPSMGPFILYEFCENGTLKESLVQHKNDVSIQLQESLYRYGLDIAKGMEYLLNNGIVHRRLAARNILLTFLNEVKIAGFGPQPAEDNSDAETGKRERIPVKWMAPECMGSTRDATEKSDVWSYAVVLWEIFSLGATPYENIRSRELPGKLKKGYRLHKPEQCDDVWYDVMKRCWTYEGKGRPSFVEIRCELDGMFESSGDEYYYCKK